MRLIASADSRSSAEEAYTVLLETFGNNHAGTFYPAALRAAEQLRDLRESGGPHWVRWVASEVLADWAGAFRSEDGFNFAVLPSGEQCEVEREVKSMSHAMIPNLDEPRPCPVCGSGPEQSSDPARMWRSVCYCGHPRYYDYKVS